VSDAAWVDAEDLSVGDAVLEADGTETVVTATTKLTVRATVHNLTVADIHTYFVLVGDAATLVHNCGVAGGIDNVLPTPQVESTRLQNIVNNLYKGTTNPSRHGNGTTMDAVRFESSTGLPVFGRTHTTKAQESLNGLNSWLARNSGASPYDQLVARSLADELSGVLGQ
jgi:hypothetical protein